MEHHTALQLAKAELKKWELDGWTCKINNRLKRALGRCCYGPKTIELSAEYVSRNEVAEVMDTILHEIAHAKAGGGAGHGPVWKAWCRKVGAKPQRLASPGVKAAERPWQVAAWIDGSLVRFNHKAYRRTDLSQRFIRGQRENTLGKLIWVEAQ